MCSAQPFAITSLLMQIERLTKVNGGTLQLTFKHVELTHRTSGIALTNDVFVITGQDQRTLKGITRSRHIAFASMDITQNAHDPSGTICMTRANEGFGRSLQMVLRAGVIALLLREQAKVTQLIADASIIAERFVQAQCALDDGFGRVTVTTLEVDGCNVAEADRDALVIIEAFAEFEARLKIFQCRFVIATLLFDETDVDEDQRLAILSVDLAITLERPTVVMERIVQVAFTALGQTLAKCRISTFEMVFTRGLATFF